MTYVEIPDKKQKHPHYEHRTAKLDRKNNEFSSKKFQKIRKYSTHKKILESLGRIGICLNERSTAFLPKKDLNKVCFILINDYYNEDKKLGVGPLNDGYLIGLKHHRLGFKIFYMYNPKCETFTIFLGFLIKNAKEALTIFYSGRDNNSDGIEFIDSTINKNSINEIIVKNCSGLLRITFITDCLGNGSVFDIKGCTNSISFSVQKTCENKEKNIKRFHGIFTYYFCKIISDSPSISPKRLVERINPSLKRFNENFTYELTNDELCDTPIFF